MTNQQLQQRIETFKHSLIQDLKRRKEYSDRTNRIEPARRNTSINLYICEDVISLHPADQFYVVEYIDDANLDNLNELLRVKRTQGLTHGFFMRLEDPIDDLQNGIITTLPSSTYAPFDVLCLIKEHDFDTWFEERFNEPPDKAFVKVIQQLTSLYRYKAP